MDADLKDIVIGGIGVQSKHASELNQMADRNLTQGLGVVHDTVIQSQAATADDAQLLAALQTASRSPAQGANTVTP